MTYKSTDPDLVLAVLQPLFPSETLFSEIRDYGNILSVGIELKGTRYATDAFKHETPLQLARRVATPFGNYLIARGDKS